MKAKFWVMGLALLLSGCATNGQNITEEDTLIDESSIGVTDTDKPSDGDIVSDTETDESSIDEETTETVYVDEAALEAGVSFSDKGGAYVGDVRLALSSEGGTIYYTSDGSDPRVSGSRMEYKDELILSDLSEVKNVVSAVDPNLFDTAHCKFTKKTKSLECYLEAPEDSAVDKCHVIKAAVCIEDQWSQLYSQTYFIGAIEDHIQNIADACESAGEPLMLVSITMNYDDLFDYNDGIYVRGASFDESWAEYMKSANKLDDECGRKLLANYSQRGREWEREAYVDFYEYTSSSAVNCISQSCGIRIQGNYSRSDAQKGFRLYARKEYGNNRFEYEIFNNALDENGKLIDSYKTLTLRNGGNCAFTTKFSDTFWQTLIGDSLDVSTKASRPAVVYLNGEYWGLYVLEEDYSSEYFEDHYGVESKDVVLYKGDAETYSSGYKLDLGEAPEGEEDKYYLKDMWRFVKKHGSVANQEDYDILINYVDEQSFIDYFAVECWINNKWDWPGKNWSMWKVTTEGGEGYSDGRWRLCVYDVEFGGVSGKSDATTNTIKEDNYKTYGLLDQDTNNVPVRIFALLMTNERFRESFYQAVSSLSDNQFELSACENTLSRFEKVYGSLLYQFYERYPDTGDVDSALNGNYASSKCIRDFYTDRPDNIQKLIDYCEKILKKKK